MTDFSVSGETAPGKDGDGGCGFAAGAGGLGMVVDTGFGVDGQGRVDEEERFGGGWRMWDM